VIKAAAVNPAQWRSVRRVQIIIFKRG